MVESLNRRWFSFRIPSTAAIGSPYSVVVNQAHQQRTDQSRWRPLARALADAINWLPPFQLSTGGEQPLAVVSGRGRHFESLLLLPSLRRFSKSEPERGKNARKEGLPYENSRWIHLYAFPSKKKSTKKTFRCAMMPFFVWASGNHVLVLVLWTTDYGNTTIFPFVTPKLH